MPFVDRSTLTYPATNAFPVRKWLDQRDPVSGLNGDYKNFQIFDIWINEAAQRAWIMVDRTVNSGTWIQMASSGTGILTITGDVGGAVGPDGANNVNLLSGSNLTVTGTPADNTLTITLDGSVANQYDEDVGTAIPAAGVLNILGGSGISTAGAGNTVTITSTGSTPLQFTEDLGTATPALNNLNVFGGTGVTTTGAGDTVTIDISADVANLYTCDTGTATPSANNLNVFGAGGVETSGSGDTITISVTGGGIVWNEITIVGPTPMECDNGYIANNAISRVQLTLPLTSPIGCEIKIHGKGAGGWQINQNAGQIIHVGESATTTGVTGTVQSVDQYDALEMHCITANTEWAVMGAQGNFVVT